MTSPLYDARLRAAILLAAGRPGRGRRPAALAISSGMERQGPVLDWLLACYPDSAWDVRVVLGYEAPNIARAYPKLNFSLNPDWETGGPVASMFSAPWPENGELAVSYTDVVYQPDLVERLLEEPGDIVAAVDGHAMRRYEGRSDTDRARADWLSVTPDGTVSISGAGGTDKEFAGVVLFRSAGIAAAKALWARESAAFARARLGSFLTRLATAGARVRAVDVAGQWAELNAPQDLAHFLMGTKARTLTRLAEVVKRARVPRHTTFTLERWRNEPETVLAWLARDFAGETVAIRSSCAREDTWITAGAGRFDSVLSIEASDSTSLTTAIGRVVSSYGNDGDSRDEVLVQCMVERIRAAGVAFTRTLERGAPYLVINYEETGATDGVTSGQGRELRTLFIRRGTKDHNVYPSDLPPSIRDLPEMLHEIERLLGHDALDIEFAVDDDGTVWLLQARPLVVDHSRWKTDDRRVHEAVEAARGDFLRAQRPRPFARGACAPFSLMTDWNPAEIIGSRPTRLPFSLYRWLVTDEIWARQRAEFGYKDVRPCPLMRRFAGPPYIDTRASFASFIPATLPDELAGRLLDYYLSILHAKPELHDKAELEILHTCLAFDFYVRSAPLRAASFTDREIDALRTALVKITRGAFARPEREHARLGALDLRRRRIRAAGLDALEEASVLLEECRSATLCFAHLARTGFVAAAFLRSLSTERLLPPARLEEFHRSLRTVARSFREDAWAVREGNKSMEDFVAEYGHLRPGTYDITIPCYAADVERYLAPAVREAVFPESVEFAWRPDEADTISQALFRLDLPLSMEAFDAFLRRAIEGREYAKFVFTRLLSDALESLAVWAGNLGIGRAELSHLPLNDLLMTRLGEAPSDMAAWLSARAAEGQEEWELGLAVELPSLLLDEKDFDRFLWPDDHPNFVGLSAVGGLVAIFDGAEPTAWNNIEGRIALITQADPGFDWLFCRRPLGLITCYGGSNSHMAIRAAELGLTSAIGVGEKKFAALRTARTIRLDPLAKRVEIIN